MKQLVPAHCHLKFLHKTNSSSLCVESPMGGESRQLHVAFFPLMAPGHIIPILNTARLFAARSVKTTILTTPFNARSITKSLNINIDGACGIAIEVIPFPSAEAGLPQDIENLANVNVTSPEMVRKFMQATQLLKEPLEKFLEKNRPDCLVADMFFPFATDIAAKFSIPRLIFHGSSFILMAMMRALNEYEPHKSVMSDDEPFVVPHLPHEIKMTKSQLAPEMRGSTNDEVSDMGKLFAAAHVAELKSFGVLFNSFYELEPDYVDYYRSVMAKRAWHIGPVSLCNGNNIEDDEYDCLKWLNNKEPNSVIYICFGSLVQFSSSQLEEIAMALEASKRQFIWVVKKLGKAGEIGNEEWSLEGFEKRMQDMGLIIRGWAPQVRILRHQAIGGFVTHCGWNSILEGVSAGVPMATWPLFADQFCNEKLVTEVLKIGVPVGSKQWDPVAEGVILKRERIEAAVDQLLVGEEALEMRSRANELKEMAWKAMEEGGSSFADLSSLIQEFSCYQP